MPGEEPSPRAPVDAQVLGQEGGHDHAQAIVHVAGVVQLAHRPSTIGYPVRASHHAMNPSSSCAHSTRSNSGRKARVTTCGLCHRIWWVKSRQISSDRPGVAAFAYGAHVSPGEPTDRMVPKPQVGGQVRHALCAQESPRRLLAVDALVEIIEEGLRTGHAGQRKSSSRLVASGERQRGHFAVRFARRQRSRLRWRPRRPRVAPWQRLRQTRCGRENRKGLPAWVSTSSFRRRPGP